MLAHAPGEAQRRHLAPPSARASSPSSRAPRRRDRRGRSTARGGRRARCGTPPAAPAGRAVARHLEDAALLLRARAAPPARRGRTPARRESPRRCRLSTCTTAMVERAVDADDAAVDRHRVARPWPAPSPRRPCWPSATPHGLVCLITTAAGSSNSSSEPERGREVEHVVVAELGAVQLLHAGQPDRRGAHDPIERRRLVRVLAVAQRRTLAPPRAAKDAETRRDAARASPARCPASAGRRRWPRRTAPSVGTPPGPDGSASRRSARRRWPAARRARPRYWLGSVTTATPPWFLAAARIIAGPPTSICSIASAGVTPGRATVASNG